MPVKDGVPANATVAAIEVALNWIEVGCDDIQLPHDMVLPSDNLHGLINHVYPDLADHQADRKYFLERGILAPKNDDVDHINDIINNIFLGQITEYLSADSVERLAGGYQQNHLYPVEFLNSM